MTEKINRNMKILELLSYGWTYTKIMKRFKLKSKGNVWQIVHRAKKKALANGRKNFKTKTDLHLKRCSQKETDITFADWNLLKKKWGFKCASCGKKEIPYYEPLCMDHIVAPKLGGKHTLKNIQPLCVTCNSSKGQNIVKYSPKKVIHTPTCAVLSIDSIMSLVH